MRHLKLTALSLLILGASPAFTQQAPPKFVNDDALKQEERDQQYMAELAVKRAQDQAAMTASMRQQQERAAQLQTKMFEGVLEEQRRQSGQLLPEEQLAMAMKNGMPNPAAAPMTIPASAMPRVANAGGPQANGQSPLQNLVDTMALEDGPEIARAKGYGFVPQGTIAEVRLLTAVNTSIPGVVLGQLVYDLWDCDGRVICVPRGSKLIGQAASMGSDSEKGGKVVFHTIVDPAGHAIPLATPVISADRRGITGLPGTIDYHWGKILGGSLALAVVAGVTGGNSAAPGNQGATFSDSMRQGMVQQIGQGSQQLLQRFSRIQPDITLEEGSVAKIIITTSFLVRPYRTAWVMPGVPLQPVAGPVPDVNKKK